MSKFLTVERAAVRVGKSVRTIGRWKEAGLTVFGGLIREDDLLKMDKAMRERRGRPRKVKTDPWHRGDWMQTFTGKRFYPLAPRPEDIDPLDIAHALSLLCRYNGHIDRFYSVAEHCVLMSRVMPTEALALEALLHDGSEAYCGDMVRPLKHTTEMTPYRVAEDRVMDALAVRFGLSLDTDGHHHKSPDVQDADTRILLTERTALMSNYKPSDKWKADGMEPLDVEVEGWSPAKAEWAYIERLRELGVRVEVHDHDPGGCTCGCPVRDCPPCGGFPESNDSETGENR